MKNCINAEDERGAEVEAAWEAEEMTLMSVPMEHGPGDPCCSPASRPPDLAPRRTRPQVACGPAVGYRSSGPLSFRRRGSLCCLAAPLSWGRRANSANYRVQRDRMSATYTAVIQRDGNWWIGWVEEVPGVNSQGATREALLDNLRDALEEALEMNREDARAAASGAFEEVSLAL